MIIIINLSKKILYQTKVMIPITLLEKTSLKLLIM